MREALDEHRALLDWVRASDALVGEAANRLVRAYERGGGVLAFGNGGSAGDAQHLAAELVGRYVRERRPLQASSLA
ncbi:MAG TPA: SIS domain-containing protein, partial [Solirubrobacter sp.]|nr:SIS domain-containing protein [Solirubrobacter sp.]